MCTDNFYTSYDLAKKLLEKQTHLVGTLRKNRKYNPASVVTKKGMKKGEIVGKEDSKTGITVMKWKDKREVTMLSTKNTCEMGIIENRNKQGETISTVQKPMAVIDTTTQNKGLISLIR